MTDGRGCVPLWQRLKRSLVGFFRGVPCGDCGRNPGAVYWHHNDWRCNPCIVARDTPSPEGKVTP